MAKVPNNTKISRTIYPPSETDEAVKELANEYGDSIAGTYKNLVEIGLAVETVAHIGGEVTVTLPDESSFVLAGPQGVIQKPKISRVVEENRGGS